MPRVFPKSSQPDSRCPVQISDYLAQDHGHGGTQIRLSEPTVTIPPNTRSLIDTNIALRPPPDSYIRIAPRSGLAIKLIDVHAGVIDPDYRGSVKVITFNMSARPHRVIPGMRICHRFCRILPYFLPHSTHYSTCQVTPLVTPVTHQSHQSHA